MGDDVIVDPEKCGAEPVSDRHVIVEMIGEFKGPGASLLCGLAVPCSPLPSWVDVVGEREVAVIGLEAVKGRQRSTEPVGKIVVVGDTQSPGRRLDRRLVQPTRTQGRKVARCGACECRPRMLAARSSCGRSAEPPTQDLRPAKAASPSTSPGRSSFARSATPCAGPGPTVLPASQGRTLRRPAPERPSHPAPSLVIKVRVRRLQRSFRTVGLAGCEDDGGEWLPCQRQWLPVAVGTNTRQSRSRVSRGTKSCLDHMLRGGERNNSHDAHSSAQRMPWLLRKVRTWAE